MNIITDNREFVVATVLTVMATLIFTLTLDFRTVNALIALHVILASLAFAIGGVSLLSRKGGPLHKRTGQLFYLMMVISCTLTLIVSMMPNHISPTMFQISVLGLYFLIGGKRSIAFKKPEHRVLIDQLLAYSVVSVGLVVVFYSLVLNAEFHPLRTVFSSVGIVFGVIDLWAFKRRELLIRKWLAFHLSKMTAGYTTAVTGFFVAQNILSGYYNWFTPTVIYLAYLAYWLIKLKVFQPVKVNSQQESKFAEL